MKKITLLATAIIFSFTGFSQPAIQWQKCFGGSGHDNAYSVQQTFDKGYIVAGSSYSDDGNVTGHHGSNVYKDYWIVKLDSNGTLLWQKSLGGVLDDVPNSIQQTTDTGYIVTGYAVSNDGDVTGNHGGTDYWVVKLDNNGGIQWQRALGGSDYEQAWAIRQTRDNGYIIGGTSNSNNGDVSGNHSNNYDYFLIKLDNNGATQWKKCLGGTYSERFYSIEQTSDSGYIVAGVASSYDGDVTGIQGKWDYWIVKLDGSGNIQWQKTFGGTQDDTAYSIAPTSDGGFIVGGASNSSDGDVTGNHGAWDYWIIRLDANGNLYWKKSFGGTLSEYAPSIIQTVSGDFIVAGYTLSVDGDIMGNHGGYDEWIVRLDANGNVQWKQCYGGTSFEYANSFQQTNDGGYIVAGGSYSNDGDVTGNHGGWDYWVVKLSPEEPIGVGDNFHVQQGTLNISPNPAMNELAVSSGQWAVEQIEIYNVLGEKRLTLSRVLGTPKGEGLRIDVSSLAPGIYFLKARNEKEERVAKFIKQ